MKNTISYFSGLVLSLVAGCNISPLVVPSSVETKTTTEQPDVGRDNMVNLGKGTSPFIAGSASGFGVVWKGVGGLGQNDSTVFSRIDLIGRKTVADQETVIDEAVSAKIIGIYPTTEGYLANIRHQSFTDILFYGQDGQKTGALNDSLCLNLIANSDAKAFVFLDNGTKNPSVQQGWVTPSAYRAGEIHGSALAPVSTTAFGVQLGNTWAYGTQNETGIIVTVVRGNGVFKSHVSMYDSQNPPAPNSFSIGDLVATDDGYVQSWYYIDRTGRHAYLSFVHKDGLTDGNVQSTFETTNLLLATDRIDHLAWNGVSVGLLTASSTNGTASLYRIGKDGSTIGEAVTIANGQQDEGGLHGALAASGSTFGVVVSSDSNPVVRFRSVSFD